MSHLENVFLKFALCVGATTIIGCGETPSPAGLITESTTEIAIAALAGVVHFGDQSGGGILEGAMGTDPKWSTQLTIAKCSSPAEQTCAANKIKTDFGVACADTSLSSVWRGSLNFEISGTGCTCASLTGTDLLSLPKDCKLLRTTAADILNAPTAYQNSRKTVIYMDTDGSVTGELTSNPDIVIPPLTNGYDNHTLGPTEITCGTGGCGSNRSITMRGTHFFAYYDDNALIRRWDATIHTAEPITVTGKGASRVITGGVLTVQNNFNQFKGTVRVDAALTHKEDCCYPVSGSLRTDFSGNKTGTESLRFGPVCGQATFVDTGGTSREVSLVNCL